MRIQIKLTAAALLLSVLCFTRNASADPQDNWQVVGYSTSFSLPTYPGGYGGNGGMIVSPSGLIYSYSSLRPTRVYDTNLNLLQELGNYGDIEFMPDGRMFTSQSALAIGTNSLIYTANLSASSVQVKDTNGTLVNTFGSSGTLDGQFHTIVGIEAAPDGTTHVVADYRVQVFDLSGNYIRQFPLGAGGGWVSENYSFAPDGQQVGSGSEVPGEIAFSPDGQFRYRRVPATGGVRVEKSRRAYRTAGTTNFNAIPLPQVIKVEQRPGTGVIDVHYRVIDPDNARVNTAAVAFLAGQTGLDALVPIRTLVDGTAANLGTNTPTGTNLLLTWNVAADWSTNFANTQIEVLAKDNRGLLDLHFITIPTNASQPAVTISRKGLEHFDFLNAWVWLIASGSTNVALTNGNVIGKSAPFTGLSLTTANGATTTTDGRNFLYGQLNVRSSITNEVIRAQSGNFGYEGGTFPVAPLP